MTNLYIPRRFPNFPVGSRESEAFKTELYLETLVRKRDNETNVSKKQDLEKQIKRIYNKVNNLWKY
jgi:hypothetical protein